MIPFDKTIREDGKTYKKLTLDNFLKEDDIHEDIKDFLVRSYHTHGLYKEWTIDEVIDIANIFLHICSYEISDDVNGEGWLEKRGYIPKQASERTFEIGQKFIYGNDTYILVCVDENEVVLIDNCNWNRWDKPFNVNDIFEIPESTIKEQFGKFWKDVIVYPIRCEICDRSAITMVRDLKLDFNVTTGMKTKTPCGEPHHFCEEHSRSPITKCFK